MQVSRNDVTFIKSALEKGLRIDGRQLLEQREIEIKLGKNNAFVSVGDSKYIFFPLPLQPLHQFLFEYRFLVSFKNCIAFAL